MNRLVSTTALVAILALPTAASAGIITLNEVALNDPLQQQTNNPCAFGGNDCNSRLTPEINAFTQTPTGNNTSSFSWDLESPEYSVAAIRLLFGDNFRIGLDFSQAQGQPDQVLGLFAMSINGQVVDLFVGPQAVGPTPAGNAGNGFADYVLVGFNLTGFALTDRVQFHAIMPVSNDGPDQAFFLRGVDFPPPPPPPPVPEPTTLALMGMALLGAGFMRRR